MKPGFHACRQALYQLRELHPSPLLVFSSFVHPFIYPSLPLSVIYPLPMPLSTMLPIFAFAPLVCQALGKALGSWQHSSECTPVCMGKTLGGPARCPLLSSPRGLLICVSVLTVRKTWPVTQGFCVFLPVPDSGLIAPMSSVSLWALYPDKSNGLGQSTPPTPKPLTLLPSLIPSQPPSYLICHLSFKVYFRSHLL